MILVTGGTGLVGAHLLRELLSRGELSIRATYRTEASLGSTRKIFSYQWDDPDSYLQKIEWVQTDLFDVVDLDQVMEGVHTIYHCAAIVSFQPDDKQLMLEGNPKMTKLLVNAALAAKVDAFIHVSSVAALGRAPQGEVTTEKTEWKDSPTNSTYSESKYAAELEIWRGIEEGLKAGMVNPAIILGPGNWKSGSSKFFHTFYHGFKFYTQGQTGFVDVADVVEALIRVTEQRAFSQRFLIVGENLPYKTLFDWITSAYNRPAPSILPPKWVMGLLWRLEWIRSKLFGTAPMVTRETAQSAQSIVEFSHLKSVEILGMKYTPISETVKKYAALYESDLAKNRV